MDSEADETCSYRGILLVFHLTTSLSPYAVTMLHAGVSAEKKQQHSPQDNHCGPVHCKESPKPAVVTSVFHQFTADTNSSHYDWARLCWCLLCSERPEAVEDPSLLPGCTGWLRCPKTAEAHQCWPTFGLCIHPAGLKEFAFHTPQERCKD